MPLKIICAWCGKYLGEKEASDTNKSTHCITHSICPDCKEKVMLELEEIPSQNQQVIIR
jgi:DNA-directed RNA polymerase subunit RPC12/RpoP